MPHSRSTFANPLARRPAGALALAAMILGTYGCQTQPDRDYEPVVAQFFLEVPAQMRDALPVELPRSGVQISVTPRAVLTELDVRNVELVKVDLGLCLMFEFSADGGRSLARLSSANIGRRLVVTLNGRPFGARTIDGPLLEGLLLIFVELPDDELADTAVNLKRTAQEIQAALAEGRGKTVKDAKGGAGASSAR